MRKIYLQLWAMTPLTLTGCFKILPSKDFPMQINISYWLEIFLFITPVMILQIVNSFMLDNWKIEAILSISLLGLNLVLNVRGLIVITDLMD